MLILARFNVLKVQILMYLARLKCDTVNHILIFLCDIQGIFWESLFLNSALLLMQKCKKPYRVDALFMNKKI